MSSWNLLFLVGTSAGGVSAIHSLLDQLDEHMKDPIVIIQHLPDNNSVDVAAIYKNKYSNRQVCEIEDKMPIESDHIYFAPGGYHVLIEKDLSFSLNRDEPVHFSRPSIDLCFMNAAETLGDRIVALVMTGANADGAEGLLAVHRAGGTTLVQDPTTAEFAEMPSAALALHTPNFVCSLKEIPDIFLRLSQRGPTHAS